LDGSAHIVLVPNFRVVLSVLIIPFVESRVRKYSRDAVNYLLDEHVVIVTRRVVQRIVSIREIRVAGIVELFPLHPGKTVCICTDSQGSPQQAKREHYKTVDQNYQH